VTLFRSSKPRSGPREVDLAACRAATERNPHDPELWLNRADAAQAAGVVPEVTESLFRMADLYLLAGLRAQAAAPIRRILAIDPRHPGARRLLRVIGGEAAEEVEATRPRIRLAEGTLDEEVPAPTIPAGLEQVGSRLELTAGTRILTEGEFGRTVYVLVSGTATVTVTDPARNTILKVAELAPGAVIGELSFLLGARRTATVTALTDVTLLELAPEALSHKLAQDRQLHDFLTRCARGRLLSLMAVAFATAAPFSMLTVAERHDLIRKMRLRRLKTDEALVERGQKTEGLYLVALGRLEAYVPGPVPRIVKKLGRGEILDERDTARLTVRAAEPSCVFVLDRAQTP
jgi:CRP-like cAMP-binding protein